MFFNKFPNNVDVFLVGGAVRAMQLEEEANDYDFVLVGLDSFDQVPEVLEVLGCQPLPQKKGASFVLNESAKTAKAKHPVLGVLDFKMVEDLEDDLKSRDFTVNAMALNCQTLQLVDPCLGQLDLQHKFLTPCNERCFLDSPERVFRAVRFAGNGFEIGPFLHALAEAPELLKVIKNTNKDRLAQQADRMFQRGSVFSVFQFFAQHEKLANALLQEKLQLRSLVQ